MPSPDAPLCEWALHYASKGIPIFPVAAKTKIPLKGSRGVDDATTDTGKIKAWWAANPHANIGAACGHAFDVVDLDGMEGQQTFKEREKENKSSIIASSKTPGGGYHVFYEVAVCPMTNGVKKLPGIDLRTKGGYVLLPPSYIIDEEKGYEGGYKWRNGQELNGTPLPNLPKWIVDAFKRSANAASAVVAEVFPEGERSDKLFRFGCLMRRKGSNEFEILATLRAMNESRCRPVMDDDEIKAIAKSCCRYDPALEAESPKPSLPIVPGKGLKLTQFVKETFRNVEPTYIVEPYLQRGKCVLLDADGGTGKSCLCAAWSAVLTSGMIPITAEPCQPINVLYLHRGEDTNEEITTIFAANGGNFDRWYLFSDKSLQFDPEGLSALEETIVAQNIQLVVVDALFYFLSSLMENTYNALPAMAVMEQLNGIAERTDCTFLDIRHTKKGNPDTKASDLGMGSVQFRNSHRGQLLLRFHPDEPGVIVCTDEKGSLLNPKGKPFCYRREGLEIVYLPEMENPFQAKKAESKSKDCKGWLWSMLGHGAYERTTIIQRGIDAGYSKSTIYDAAGELNISKKHQPSDGQKGQPPVWWARQGFDWSSVFDDPYA